MLKELEARVAALERRLARAIRIGRVAAVQGRPYRVQVDLGDGVVSPWLHVLVSRSGASMVDFSPLDVGEGVLVLAPGGGDVQFALPSLARGRIELVGDDASRRFLSGDLVAGGEVLAKANVVFGRVAGGGVRLSTHIHPTPAGPSGPPTTGT